MSLKGIWYLVFKCFLAVEPFVKIKPFMKDNENFWDFARLILATSRKAIFFNKVKLEMQSYF